MLIDDVTIYIRAGKGGNGAATFRRNAQTAKGGPDGGNGGNGGSIFVEGVNDISALSQFQYKKKILAEDGVKGGKQNKYGRNGEDTTIQVPLGTTITNITTGEELEITNEHKPVCIANGGLGGRGNNEFKSATNQTPTFAEEGLPGEEKTLHIVMHLIADIGFIGLPNAGKSSLLKSLTNANPKIGNYPFTTLEPNLGVMKDDNGKNIILADIPGLIEGAHMGKGLGTKFLKHVEKTVALVHCIDITTENIDATYEIVRKELDSFSPTLVQKNEIILLTKTDLISPDELKQKLIETKKIKKDVYTVSIYDETSLQKLTVLLQKLSQ
jgi:GTP-binding protein